MRIHDGNKFGTIFFFFVFFDERTHERTNERKNKALTYETTNIQHTQAHSVTFWSLTLLFAIVVPRLSFLQKYKLEHKAIQPSRDLLYKAYRNCILNHLVAHPLFAFVFYELAVNKAGMSTSLSNLPSVTTIATQILITLLVEDFLFYWIHRTLHHRLVYKYIHKQHHEFKANVGIAAEYFHPVEDLFNIVPMVTGPLLLKMHFCTFMIWVVIRISEIVDAHSGYALPFSIWEISMRLQGGMFGRRCF